MKEDEIDGFEFPPVGDGYNSQGFISSNPDVAWKQKLVEIHHMVDKVGLPDKLKNQVKFNIDQILTNAGMTYISQG